MNYYVSESTTDPLELKMAKVWFANVNKILMEKRQKEEELWMVNLWSSAKSRVCEEITTRIERN